MSVYDLENYIEFNSERGLYDPLKGSFISDVKALPVDKTFSQEGASLDALSYRFYNTEELWWLIQYYNDIQDPLELTFNLLSIPSLDSVHQLLQRSLLGGV